MEKDSEVLARQGRIVGFDAIRLLGCALVCVVHFNAAVSGYQNGNFVYPNSIIPNYLLGGRVYLGALGVKLFFIISGASQMLSYRPESAGKFYRKRITSIYPYFWPAFLAATFYDFFLFKGLSSARPENLIISFAGLDGYFSGLELIPWGYYKLGEWFLGCIILIYMVFPAMYAFLTRFPRTACGCFALLYFFSLYAIDHQLPYIGSSWGITLCISEFFLGMVYIYYRLDQKEMQWGGLSAAYMLIAIFLRKIISVEVLTLALAIGILGIVMMLAKSINGETAKKGLKSASTMTWPIFLVHHFICDRMVRGFDLANLPRLYTFVFFAFFVALTLLFAILLKKAGDRICSWLRQHESVLTVILILLLLSYGYTAWEVVRYHMETIAMQL